MYHRVRQFCQLHYFVNLVIIVLLWIYFDHSSYQLERLLPTLLKSKHSYQLKRLLPTLLKTKHSYQLERLLAVLMGWYNSAHCTILLILLSLRHFRYNWPELLSTVLEGKNCYKLERLLVVLSFMYHRVRQLRPLYYFSRLIKISPCSLKATYSSKITIIMIKLI